MASEGDPLSPGAECVPLHACPTRSAPTAGRDGNIECVIAHEILQPLTAIHGDAEAALRALGDTNAVRDILRDILASVWRATEIVRRARVLLQGGEPRGEVQSLGEVVAGALHFLKDELTRRGIALELQAGAPPDQVNIDRVQIEQVIVNLVMNACDAMAEVPADRRTLHIETRGGTGDRVELLIIDSGVGVAEDDRERIFQPFFTSKPDGFGLGLAISRFIVNAHGGHLCVEGAQCGARFRMSLPRHAPVPHELDEGAIEAGANDRESEVRR